MDKKRKISFISAVSIFMAAIAVVVVFSGRFASCESSVRKELIPNEFTYNDETPQSEVIAICEKIKDLPDATSVGSIPDLSYVMLRDESGVLPTLVKQFVESQDIKERESLLDEILYEVCGVATVNPESRGPHIDGRKLAALETYMGQDFNSEYTGRNPHESAAEMLKEMYNDLFYLYYYHILDDSMEVYLKQIEVMTDVNVKKFCNYTNFLNDIEKSLENSSLSDTDFIEISRYLSLNDKIAFAEFVQFFTVKDAKYQSVFDEYCADVVGTEKEDNITAASKEYVIFSKAGNDIITGTSENDFLDAGEGRDALYGGEGDDCYSFSLGYGTDIISDNSGYNTIVFGNDIKSDDLALSKDENNLIISINNSEDRIILVSYFTQETCNFRFNFKDETYAVIDKEKIELEVFIYDNVDNIYRFNKGDGIVMVKENEGQDQLEIGAEITDIIFAYDLGYLDVSFRDTKDIMNVSFWDDDDKYKIETFTSSDGYTLTIKDLEILIEDMETFAEENDTTWEDALEKYPDKVEKILKKSWKKSN